MGARRAFMGCITAFFFGLCFRVLLPLPPARLAAAADFSGSIVTLRSGSSGRYIEVGDDLWLYASSYTNNKPSVRFEVVPVPDELARALAHTREYEEPGAGVEAKGTWDLRTAAVKEATPAEPAVGQAPDDPWAGGAEWDLDRAADDDLWDGGGFDGDGGFRRRLLWGVPVGVRDGAPAAELDAERRTVLPGGRWVALRSAYGGGFVEVLPRSQADEYVARVARDGQLSFRSLLLLRRDAVWSHAVGGYINLRGAQEGDAREHLRAHGNDAPFRPLRDLAASARFHVERRAPVVDVIGAMRCPEAPTFDWNLLLDAARAVRATRGRAPRPTNRRTGRSGWRRRRCARSKRHWAARSASRRPIWRARTVRCCSTPSGARRSTCSSHRARRPSRRGPSRASMATASSSTAGSARARCTPRRGCPPTPRAISATRWCPLVARRARTRRRWS